MSIDQLPINKVYYGDSLHHNSTNISKIDTLIAKIQNDLAALSAIAHKEPCPVERMALLQKKISKHNTQLLEALKEKTKMNLPMYQPQVPQNDNWFPYNTQNSDPFYNPIPDIIQNTSLNQSQVTKKRKLDGENVKGINIDDLWEKLENIDKNHNYEIMKFDELIHRFDDEEYLCVKETAIKLGESSYLNANKMTDPDTCSKEIIAAQYPLAIASFWKEIFKNDALIIDLTNDKDVKAHKLSKYYPEIEGGSLSVENIKVDLVEERELLINYLTLYFYSVTDLDTKETKNILRYQFKEWEDCSDIPLEQLKDLVKLIEKMVLKQVWVLDLCGSGRPGTLIAAYLLGEGIRKGTIRSDNLEDQVIQIISTLRKRRFTEILETKDQISLLVEYAKYLLEKNGNANKSLNSII